MKYLVRAYIPYSGIWFEQGYNELDKAEQSMKEFKDIDFDKVEIIVK